MSELHATSRRPSFMHRRVLAAAGFARRAFSAFGLASAVLAAAITLLPSPFPKVPERGCFSPPPPEAIPFLADPETLRFLKDMANRARDPFPVVRP